MSAFWIFQIVLGVAMLGLYLAARRLGPLHPVTKLGLASYALGASLALSGWLLRS